MASASGTVASLLGVDDSTRPLADRPPQPFLPEIEGSHDRSGPRRSHRCPLCAPDVLAQDPDELCVPVRCAAV